MSACGNARAGQKASRMAEEQRAHRRVSVDFEAFVSGGGLREQACKVRDFCLGGLLLSFADGLVGVPAALRMLQRGADLDVRVLTKGAGFRDAYSFRAEVARVAGNDLGVAFRQPDPTALMALQSLANLGQSPRRGMRDPRRPRHDEAAVKRILEGVRALVEQSLRSVPGEVLDGFPDAIRELAAHAGNDARASQLLERIGLLQRNADKLQAGFLAQALKPLAGFGNWVPGGILPANNSQGRLSLIDKGAFEEWLAIKVMVSRAEGECQQALFELQLRLNELLGAQVGVQNNPVGPVVFLHALGEPIQKLKLPRDAEQWLLKRMESIMLGRLQQLYAALNEELARQGVLPDLEIGRHVKGQSAPDPRGATAARTTPSAKTPAPPATTAVAAETVPASEGASAPDGAAMATSGAPPAADAAVGTRATGDGRAALSVRQFEMQQKIAREAYATVQRLLAVRRGPPAAPSRTAGTVAQGAAGQGTAGQAAAPAVLPQVPPLPAERVSGALQAIQAVPAEAVDDSRPLQHRVREALARAGVDDAALSPAHAEAADTVDELFRQMAATPLLRDDARQQIRQLEVPFLRLMLSDESLLANERHPARQVLNRLASLGARGAMTTPRQLEQVQEVVSGLVDKFENDIRVFVDALGQLEKLLDQQRRVYQHNLARVQQASAGQHRVQQARSRVSREIERRLGGRRVPRALLTLLDSGWREAMVNTLLRDGPDSEGWQGRLAVVDDMMRAADGDTGVDLRGMLAVIKKGLMNQADGQLNSDAVVRDLREMFTAVSAGKPETVPCVDMPAGAVDAEVAYAADQTTDPAERERWLRRARELQVGDWVNFADEGDEQQARLAWTDEDRQQFVFVNLQGMKVHDLDVRSLAGALRAKRVVRIDDPETPLVDRGLEAMVQKVYGQLSHRATHDELTGLYNRKEFEKRLARHLAAANEGDWTLCFVDLDQFKVINNNCGHEAGNRLLKDLAGVVVAAAGKEAEVARLGGDEFAVLAPAAGSAPLAERLLHAIEGYRFSADDRSYPVAASAGVVHLDGTIVVAGELMKAAEAACYAAKEAGRNRAHVYRAGDAALAERDDIMQWVSRLNQAIDNNRLQLRCQRIEPVDPESGLKPHYEILIAIEDEAGEFIPPSAFMQAAERYNRMHAVDRWVINNVLDWMHANPQKLEGIGGFSINLSGQSLNDAKLTRFIIDKCAASAVARELVTFEVTETAAIANLQDAVEFIRELQAIGCRFSLDDFGSGLSSYSYLKNLPVDFVKIDGAFVRDLHRSAEDYMMVRSINEMAHFMGKRTVAEYVENDDILAALREIGVDYAQGYGIERPKPLSTL